MYRTDNFQGGSMRSQSDKMCRPVIFHFTPLWFSTIEIRQSKATSKLPGYIELSFEFCPEDSRRLLQVNGMTKCLWSKRLRPSCLCFSAGLSSTRSCWASERRSGLLAQQIIRKFVWRCLCCATVPLRITKLTFQMNVKSSRLFQSKFYFKNYIKRH